MHDGPEHERIRRFSPDTLDTEFVAIVVFPPASLKASQTGVGKDVATIAIERIEFFVDVGSASPVVAVWRIVPRTDPKV